MVAKSAAQKKAESQTSPMDDAQTGSEPKIEVEGTEKVASGLAHVHAPGMSEILGGPTADSLNPAFAPLTEEEDEKGVKSLGLEPQKPAEEKSESK